MPNISITITMPIADAEIVAKDLGQWLGLKDDQGKPRSATVVEAKGAVVQWLQGISHSYRMQEAQQDISIPALDIT